MKPGGKFHMIDLDRVGGVPVVLKHLLDAGLLHGDCLTVTGKTMAENLAEIDPPAPDGVVVHPLEPTHRRRGRHQRAHAARSRPRASVVKVAGLTHDQRVFEGAARVFEGEDGAMDAILAGSIEPGTVIVIRYEGPKGGPGMREMLAVTGALKGAGRGARLRARSPTVASAAARGASASATWRPKPSTVGPSRSSQTATASASTCPTCASTSSSTTRRSRHASANWKLPEPRYTIGLPRQVRQVGARRRKGCDHPLIPRSAPPSRNHCS